jgi:hypothetical protein
MTELEYQMMWIMILLGGFVVALLGSISLVALGYL